MHPQRDYYKNGNKMDPRTPRVTFPDNLLPHDEHHYRRQHISGYRHAEPRFDTITSLVNDNNDDDDDLLLDELLEEPVVVKTKQSHQSKNGKDYKKTKTPTDDTSKTSDPSDSPRPTDVVKHVSVPTKQEMFKHVTVNHNAHDHRDDSSISTDSEDNYANQKPYEMASAQELLAQANVRIKKQEMQDEIKGLKNLLSKKDEEILNLTGQLRRAVSTKCDLVLAHTELERHHEKDIKIRDQNVKVLRKQKLTEQEIRAEIEVQFMNEIVQLTEKIKDMERVHRNEILERDFEIAKLEQQLRRSFTSSVRPESSRTRRTKF